MLWMRDVNKARTEKTPKGMLDRLSAREVAEFHLNKFFDMVEDHLKP